MAKDADGNYYYEAGTIAEQLDGWEVYEDADGNVGFYNGTSELRLQNAGHVFGDSRSAPTLDELDDGEVMLYVDSGDGQLYAAVNDGGAAINTTALTSFVFDGA